MRYAILGSIIPIFVIAYYTNNIMDDLYNQINDLKDNNYCDYYDIQSFDVTVTTYNPTRSQTDSTPNQTADGTIRYQETLKWIRRCNQKIRWCSRCRFSII